MAIITAIAVTVWEYYHQLFSHGDTPTCYCINANKRGNAMIKINSWSRHAAMEPVARSWWFSIHRPNCLSLSNRICVLHLRGHIALISGLLNLPNNMPHVCTTNDRVLYIATRFNTLHWRCIAVEQYNIFLFRS